MVYIDAHNYLKRIYHGGGSPYGLFYNMMVKYENTPLEVVCDGSGSRKHRKTIHPGYKAGRDQGDDPVYWEVYNNCIELALQFGSVRVIRMTAGEADDYIADRAREGDTVISNDKDLWPLIERGVNILLNATTAVDRDLVELKMQCVPRHIQLYKTLVGDPSDKIPGKRGFGKAAWEKLSYEDRELYSHHFKRLDRGDTEKIYDEKIMTESAQMSWKLALPWQAYEFEKETSPGLGEPMAFIESKGIML